MGGYSFQECDSCGDQAGGYTRTDLEKQGWVWHIIPTTFAAFVMCSDCEHAYEQRRRDAELIKSAVQG